MNGYQITAFRLLSPNYRIKFASLKNIIILLTSTKRLVKFYDDAPPPPDPGSLPGTGHYTIILVIMIRVGR